MKVTLILYPMIENVWLSTTHKRIRIEVHEYKSVGLASFHGTMWISPTTLTAPGHDMQRFTHKAPAKNHVYDRKYICYNATILQS